jgi:type VI secretion system secreted protein Hcp
MAISIFMEIESTTDGVIEGGCDIKGREGWMECLEMSHSLHTPYDKTTGSITGTRVHEPLQITKMTDNATPLLYKHLCLGIKMASVKLHYYLITPAGKELEYFTIEMKNAQVIAMDPIMYNTRSAQWEKMPHLEVIRFGYEEISWTENRDNIQHMDNYRNDNV